MGAVLRRAFGAAYFQVDLMGSTRWGEQGGGSAVSQGRTVRLSGGSKDGGQVTQYAIVSWAGLWLGKGEGLGWGFGLRWDAWDSWWGMLSVGCCACAISDGEIPGTAGSCLLWLLLPSGSVSG